MKLKYLHTFSAIIILLAASGCSTSKNTNMSRRYHSLLVKYNIAFNGSLSYNEGLENIAKSNKDDYSQLIRMFPISNHTNASSATGNMDRTIEKSRKAIKLHSIKKKPERDYKRYNDPKYQAFYNQNEFNPELKKAWIQLGKAEFHKGDFLGAAGTFSYITRYYATDPDITIQAGIWMARAYSELDWLYEAEDILKKIKPDKVSPVNAGLYASAWADLLIRQNEYVQAIPYLKTAISHEKNKKQRIRFMFAAGQLLERIGDKKGASEYYSRVIKSTPSYQMDFNAQINIAQLSDASPSGVKSKLKRMARNRNNKDYLDQIYTALGNILINEKDSVKAIESYNLAVEKSTRNGTEKGVPLVLLGDLYYQKRDYVKAHPYYDAAAKIYTNEFKDFERINHRSEVLGELVKEYDIVHLQDSLQQLALMPEDERMAAIKRTIAKLIAEEKATEDSKLLAEMKQQDDDFRMPMNQTGGNNNWYFYNPVTVSNGKTGFRRIWGNRKLADDWRRGNKMEMLFAQDTNAENNDSVLINDTTNMQANGNTPEFTQTSDRKSVDYYMAQIPFSDAQKEKSNQQLATALFNMALVYKDKIEDYPLAHKTFSEFQSRFSSDERVTETLFYQFLIASKENNAADANQFRNEILANHSDSKYALMLEDPDYIRNQQQMFVEQENNYNKAYAAFIRSDYQSVFDNTKLMKTKFPMSKLIPQFEFLNTLSVGKTAGSDEFEKSLNALVENYPESNIGAISKDILALLKQGSIARQGQTLGSLLTMRQTENISPEEQQAMAFSELKFTPHRLMLITNADNNAINRLQYNLAIFNFSRFMIKDFGFELTQVDQQRRALSVLSLASYNECVWYQNTLATDIELTSMMDSMNIQQVIISENNFEKLKTVFTLDEYLAYEQEYLSKDVPDALLVAAKAPTPTQKITTVEIIDGTKLVEPKVNAVQTTEQTDSMAILTETKETVETTQTSEKEKEPEQPQKNKEQTTGQTDTTVILKETKETVETTQASEKEKEPEQPTLTEKPAQPETSDIIDKEASNLPKTEVKPAELFKNLYAHQPKAPHYIAFYIPKGGKFDFNTVKKALDEYNATNYGAMNLKVTLEEFGKESVIFVSTFADADVAKSYFLRMLREPTIVNATAGMNKRNLITTRDNLNTMLNNNALDIYFEFMREYYLK